MMRSALTATLLALALPAAAVDGVIEINHARALAGGVTPGDDPGYPVTLSEPGSYRLTSNLILPDANTPGVMSSGNPEVTLDLNGFAVIGPNTCSYNGGVTCTTTGNGAGISLFGDGSTVRNGFIRGTGWIGVRMGESCLVEDVSIAHAGDGGIATSTGCTVRNNRIRYVDGAGISALDQSAVAGNVIALSTSGLWVGSNSLVTGNVSSANGPALVCNGGAAYGGNVLSSSSGTTVSGSCTDIGGNL